MNKRLLLLVLFYCLSVSIRAQESADVVAHSIFLVGDAGEPYVKNGPLGEVLYKDVARQGSNTTVIFLGDNVYPKGLPERGSKSREEGEMILQTQVDWIKGLDVNAIFIPGNHDWEHWGKKGVQYIREQQQWLDSLKDSHFTMLPRDGCPGPVELKVSHDVLVVILDTQWFLHQWDKPGEDGPCDGRTAEEVLTLLADVFHRNQDKRIIVAAHHPLITYGDHGGVFTLKDHLFPLTDINPDLYVPVPVLGSLYPLYRKFFGHIQDTAHPVYKALREGIQEILKEYPGSIYVSGHEHALQYIVRDSTHFVVSGSAAKFTHPKKKKYAIFVEGVQGFVRLDIHKNRDISLHYFQVNEDFPEGREIFTTKILAQPRREAPVMSAVIEKGHVVRVNASDQYAAGGFHKKMFGENYRKEWAQKIEVPIFNIQTIKGGLKILQKGGGQQTLSLRLEDSTAHEYVIRSVEKYPEKAIPEMLRKTFAQDLVQDQISASHPYAALVIPLLAEAAAIYHTNPQVYFVPDDPALGEYRKDFANTLVLFEERPAGDWSESAFFGNSKKIINTSKVLEKLSEDNDNQVDQEFVVRCRLFDLVIGDWDRHDDQWRWATFDSKKGDTFRPIPRDRDQAFFVNEGNVSKLWSRRWALPKFEGFDQDIDWAAGLSFNARYFDRSFLTGLSKEQWIKEAKYLQASLADDVIERAIRQWPEEIYALHGEKIVRNIKSRRDRLREYAISHYEFLSREVDVTGSDKREQFEVSHAPDGGTQIKVFKITKEGEKGKKLFDRTFRKNETREIRLFGFSGDDVFRISGGKIKVRMIGGEGNDVVVDSTKGGTVKKTIFYDQKDPASLLSASRVKDKTSDDPAINEYDRKAFQYNRLAPLIYFNYNPDDGIFVGGGAASFIQGFRKSPYKQRHIFLASVAPKTWSFNFLYHGRFNHIAGKWSLDINADIKAPNYVNNFFGPGNESVFYKDIEDQPGIEVDESIQYYRYRFEEIRLEPSLRRDIGNFGFLKIGPALQRIEMEEPETSGDDRFIEDYGSTLDYNLFEGYRNFAGINWQLGVDKRDDTKFTRRGIVWSIGGRTMEGLNKASGDFSSWESSLAVLYSFRAASRLVFAIRAGAGINTGKYEFYQSQILDGKTELRGYRKTRFYGDRKFYSNFEVRLKLLSFRTYLFPASLGIIGFHDLGRVWYEDENGQDPSAANGKSVVWHKGFGGGLWFTPFNMTVLSTELAHSEDGLMGYIRLGFLF